MKEALTNLGLLISRLGLAAMMIALHGWPKLNMLMSGEIKFSNPIGIGVLPSLILPLIAEFVCSILIALGIKTRWATIPLIFTMVVAGFVFHAPDPFHKKEKALVYAIAFILLLIKGPGKISLDYAIWGRKGI